jgi:predicted DNA-binding protein
MPAEKTEQIMVRMSPELLQRLRKDADTAERSVAQTVRLAIRTYLESSEGRQLTDGLASGFIPGA